MSLPEITVASELGKIGHNIGNPIKVRVSNEIVTLLSSNLYQSPLKAIEELVVNSYDAGAGECRLFVPIPGSDRQVILVYDDGEGMDSEGLTDLWMIARSKKRAPDFKGRGNRKQIGKFGIGKLATYAVANKITHISRTEDQILAVTADFRDFHDSPGADADVSDPVEPVELPVSIISTWSDLADSDTLQAVCDGAGVDIDSLISSSNEHWTMVILEDIKEDKPIQPGRLRWVLSTAMPLRSDFKLFLNGEEVVSSKEKILPIIEFSLNEMPCDRLAIVNKETGEDWHKSGDGLISVSFPEGVYGSVIVTKRTLNTGKSNDLGRSHGFFIKVRERLINSDDPLFGLTDRSYQTFYRFRVDITADDLDDAVTAQREGIVLSPLREKILPLLREIFAEARTRYTADLAEQDANNSRRKEHDRSYIPVRLVEHPLADVLSIGRERTGTGSEGNESWFYLNDVAEIENANLVKSLYESDRRESYNFDYQDFGQASRFVKYDPNNSTFYMNENHDLVIEYREDSRARMLLEDIAVAETMLEIYLREASIPAHKIGEILEKRDSLLRGLALERMSSLTALAQFLRDSASDKYDLEVALVAASRALGFVATHIGGAGQPDGVARFTDYPGGERKITLEAKSSKDIPSLSHLDFAGLVEHIGKHDAHGCLLVAPGYPGSNSGDQSAVYARSREGRISCWTIEQLATVVEAVETRHIGATRVLEIILEQFAPTDVTSAIENLLSDPKWEHRNLYVEILQTLRSLEGRLEDVHRTVDQVAGLVSQKSSFTSIRLAEIGKALADIAGSSQGGLLLNENQIIINVSLDELERRVSALTGSSGEEPQPRRNGTFRRRNRN